MKPPSKTKAAGRIQALLAQHLGTKPERLRSPRKGRDVDFTLSFDAWTFEIEYRNSASSGLISATVRELADRRGAKSHNPIQVLAVPYMGDSGREICHQADVSWLDLSGNAHITGPGLRIIVEGRSNQFTRRGRPTNLFAPRSSRIARHLLFKPNEFQTQTELARATQLDDGYVSKLVRRLKDEQLVNENKQGAIRPRDPALLLDAWRDAYDFEKHQIIKGHVAARSGDGLLESIAMILNKQNVSYAATGLGAAWLWTKFAGFRITTIYLNDDPTPALLKDLKFVPEEPGANTWLVVPNDEGVFDDGVELANIRCVSALQVYLDLQSHPERAKEAATAIRERYLNWKPNA